MRRHTFALFAAVTTTLLYACTEPPRLIADTCGDGVVESGEDCDGDSGGSGLTCGAPGTAHACHFVCDATTTRQCPVGDTCDSAGVCESAPGVCGNGIIEGDEDCDPTIPTTLGQCGAAGTANGCFYVCSTMVACPSGASCGRDGRCREPSGQFIAAASSPAFPSALNIKALDVDGDGLADLVDTQGLANFQDTFGFPLVVEYSAGDGTFPQQLTVQQSVSAIGDLTGTGLPSFAFQGAGGGPIQIAVAQPNRTLTQAPFPTFAVTNPGPITDKWVPIHPVAGNPREELLHAAIGSQSATFGFDEDEPDQLPVTVPATTFPGDLTSGQPPPFSIADAIDNPGVGGDEIAIGMIGTSTIGVYTATAGGVAPNGALEPLYHLALDQTISLGSATIQTVPIFADIDGNGTLDILVTVDPGGTGPYVTMDLFNSGTSFGTPTVDTVLSQGGQCPATAAGKLFGSGSSELFCAGAVFQRIGNQIFDISADGAEVVFPDINHDGIPDMVLAGRADQASLIVMYGSTSGLFSTTNVPVVGQATSLRVGDFNGDGIDDVLFYTTDANGSELNPEQQYAVLYGSTGQLAPPTTVATLVGVTAAEPAILASDATLSPTPSSATTSLVVSSTDAGSAVVTELLGSANETLTSAGFTVVPLLASAFGIGMAPGVIGHFGSGQADELALAIQGQAADNLFGTLDVVGLVTDQNMQPLNEQPSTLSSIAAPGLVPPSFLLEECPAMAMAADFDGDGIDEVVYLQVYDIPVDAGCTPLNPPPFAVLQAANPTAQPVPMPTTDLTNIQELRALDIDGDGHLDLLAVFGGQNCTSFPCAPVGNGVLIIWGSSTGLSTATTELRSATLNAQINDVALLPLATGDPGHLIVATANGAQIVDVGSNRSLTPGAMLTTTNATAITTGDINGDGLIDLVVDTPLFPSGGQITVLFAQSQPIR
jgi:hypothetical protein